MYRKSRTQVKFSQMIVFYNNNHIYYMYFSLSQAKITIKLFLILVLIVNLAKSITKKDSNNLQQHSIDTDLKQIHQQSDKNNGIADGQNNDSLQFLIQQEYIGTYINDNKIDLFNFISSQSGTVEAILFKNQFSGSPLQIDTFQMILFDPVYHDQRALKVLVELGKMASKNQWNGTNSNIQISKFWKQRTDGEKNISDVNFTIKLSNIDNKNPTEVVIDIQFQGPDFKFHASMNYDDARLSTLGYSLYTAAAVLIQLVCSFLLVKKIDTTNPNIINKMSLTTIAMCNIEDFYLTMIHIQYIMTSGSNTYLFYVMPSLCYILLFVIYDMKLLFLVWRSHYIRQIDNPQALRKKLTTFYIKFYVGLFLYLTLTYFFSFDVWMILLQNLIMIPQIVYNARIGNNPGFQPYYVLGYMGARFLIPLYQRACPSNHFMLTPMIGLVVTLFIIYVLQMLILFLQHKCGSRFFIPKNFQPDYYNYNFKIKSSNDNKDLECSICLQTFFDDMSINKSEIEQPMMVQKTIMRTPCNHYFHRQCLASWIDVKLECPSCRAPLPPL